MAQVMGQGAEEASRHPEDEENDDGWSDAVLSAPAAVCLILGSYGAFLQGDPRGAGL